MGWFKNARNMYRVVKNSSVTYETITTPEQLEDAILQDIGGNTAGEPVTVNTALQVSAVFASIRIIGSLFASIPMILYRRGKDGIRERATDHPLYDLMVVAPNTWQTAHDFKETGKIQDLLAGGTHAWINRVNGGTKIKELILLEPNRLMIIQLPNFSLQYTYFPRNGVPKTFSQEEILHIPGMSLDGVTSLSPIQFARQSIGGALATQRYGNNLFKNGIAPGVIVRFPMIKDEDLRKDIKRELLEDYGKDDSHSPLIGWGSDFEVKSLGLSNEDAQFLETRRFQRNEIAAGIYGVPPHLIGDDATIAYNSIEQQNLSLLTHTLLSHMRRWEQSYNFQILTKKERETLYYEFDMDMLLRGDFKTRMDALSRAVLTGQLSPNEARKKNNENPYEGGNTYYMPLNMATVDQLLEEGSMSNRPAVVTIPSEDK